MIGVTRNTIKPKSSHSSFGSTLCSFRPSVLSWHGLDIREDVSAQSLWLGT